MIDPDFRHSGLLKSESVMTGLYQNVPVSNFEDLDIPLTVVAADFWERSPVVLESGPVQPAVQASMAIPGVFTPVELDGRVLIDGGSVNPVPFRFCSRRSSSGNSGHTNRISISSPT